MKRGQIVSIKRMYDGWELWPIGTIWDRLHNASEMHQFEMMYELQCVSEIQPLVGAVVWECPHESEILTKCQWRRTVWTKGEVWTECLTELLDDQANDFSLMLSDNILLHVDCMGRGANVLDAEHIFSGPFSQRWMKRNHQAWT